MGVIKNNLMVVMFLLLSVISTHAEVIGDIDGDNKVGLEESIYSLQVVSGLKPDQVEQTTLNVKSLFNSSMLGLGTVIGWVKDKIGTLTKDRVLITMDPTSYPLDQLLSKVSDGSLQAVHGWAGYHNIPAAQLFGNIPFGPEVIEYLAWLWQGNGLTLWQQIYDNNGYNVKVLPCGAITGETGGWYQNQMNTAADFNGLKMRNCGLTSLVLDKLGTISTCYGGSEVLAKFQDGSISAAEFSTPAIDSFIDFPSVATYNYFPGWHQKSTILELIINKDIWDGMSPHQQMALDMTCRAATVENMTYTEAIQSQYITANENLGVQIRTFSDDILNALKSSTAQVMAEQSLANTEFKVVWDDYSQFHANYSKWLELGFYPSR